MPAKLTLHPRDQASRFAVVQEGEALIIGRDRACGLVVEDPSVSKRHAELRWSESGWRIEDLGSKNGTLVNGVSAAGVELRSGDWISFGDLRGQFEILTMFQAATLASERLARIQTTADLRRRLASDLQLGDLLLRFLESAMLVTRAERGFVLLVRPDGALQAEVAAGFAPGHMDDGRFRGSVGAVQQALASRSPVVVSDVPADPTWGKRPSIVAAGIGSLACIPLRRGSDITGLIYLDSRKRTPAFTTLDLEILEGLADHTAAVLAEYGLEGEAAQHRADALVDQIQERLEELLPSEDASC